MRFPLLLLALALLAITVLPTRAHAQSPVHQCTGASGEVLYSDGRMVNRYERRYAKEAAPPFTWADDAEAGEVRT